MSFYGALSTEDYDTNTGAPLDVSAVIDADTASSEAIDMVVDIENDINSMGQATLASEHLRVQARTAEAILANPQGINANVAKLSFESIEQTASALGFPMEATGVHVASTESIDSDPVSAMTLSQEGIKEFFKKIIDGIKKIFKKIAVSIKKLVVKLLVAMDGTEKSAIALAKKLKESKASGGEDISESDKTKIAKLSGSAITLTGETGTGASKNGVTNFTSTIASTFNTADVKDVAKIAAAFKTFLTLEKTLDKFGLDTDSTSGTVIFIPFKYTGAGVSGVKIIIREAGKDDNFADTEFSPFKGKLSATAIDDIADKIKQESSSKTLQTNLKAIAQAASKGKAFLNSGLSLIDNIDKDLDKAMPEIDGEDTANEIKASFKSTVSGLKVAGTSLVLDMVLHYVGTQRNNLAIAKIQANKFL